MTIYNDNGKSADFPLSQALLYMYIPLSIIFQKANVVPIFKKRTERIQETIAIAQLV